jgi:hypothetical protein
MAAYTEDSLNRVAMMAAREVIAVLNGQVPTHIVNHDVAARARSLRGRQATN